MDSVGVIILTKDNFDVIKRCLDSFVEKNTYDNINFYIGDTGSSQNNLDKLYEYVKEFKYTTRVIKFNYYNFAKNNNWIVNNLIKERFILFCNDDIELINDSLTNLVNNWSEDLGTVGCKLLFSNNLIQHAGQIHVMSGSDPIGATHKLYNEKDRKLDIEYNAGNTFAFCLTTKKVFDTVNGLNTNFKTCFEDVAFNISCSQVDLKHKFVGTTSCYHHESVSRKKSKNDYIAENDSLLLMSLMRKFYKNKTK